MKSQGPKVEPIRNPTLFQMEKLEQAVNLANSLKVVRPPAKETCELGRSTFLTRIAPFQDGYLMSGGFVGSSDPLARLNSFDHFAPKFKSVAAKDVL